jgi:electron transfer flavoprotein beta subunit
VPKVLACYKWVVDGADVRVKKDLSVEMMSESKISDYDRNAIEAAVRAAKTIGGEAVGLSFGTGKCNLSAKSALSRGLKETYWINAPEAASADGKITADALAAAIRQIGDVMLVICADGASDTLARQTAPRIGGVLDWPVVTALCEMKIEGNTLTVVKKLEDTRDTVQVELPAVVSILPEVNPAPLPGLGAIMSAAKKKTTEIKGETLGIAFTTNTKVEEIKGYAMNRKNTLFKEGQLADQVKALALALRKEGAL